MKKQTAVDAVRRSSGAPPCELEGLADASVSMRARPAVGDGASAGRSVGRGPVRGAGRPVAPPERARDGEGHGLDDARRAPAAVSPPASRRRSTTPVTRTSGAEAPAVTPTARRPWSQASSISAALLIRCDSTPARRRARPDGSSSSCWLLPPRAGDRPAAQLLDRVLTILRGVADVAALGRDDLEEAHAQRADDLRGCRRPRASSARRRRAAGSLTSSDSTSATAAPARCGLPRRCRSDPSCPRPRGVPRARSG